MSGHHRLWIIAYLATCLFLVVSSVEGKSLRHASREKAQTADKNQRIRAHRRLQEEVEEPVPRLENSTAADASGDENLAEILDQSTDVTAEGDTEEEYILPLETDTTTQDDIEAPALQDGITTTTGETGSSPFSFGTTETGDENMPPYLFRPPLADEAEPTVETENVPYVNLDVSTQKEEEGDVEPLTDVDAEPQPEPDDSVPLSTPLNGEQHYQPEYANFHFGADQMHQQEHLSNPMIRDESHPEGGHYVDGNLVDQFADMFNMVHVSSGHYPSPSSGSSKGKGSVYYDEFGHGKGGKGKGGKSKGKGGSGKGGGMPHGSEDSGTPEGSGGRGGSSGKYKVSKKSSSSGSKAYRREHRLTMPPKVTNSHGGGSSERSRR